LLIALVKMSHHPNPLPQKESMKNAHERFGVLEYTKRMKDTTTRIRLRLDRFIGEVDDKRNGKAHLISIVGTDSDVGAIWAAVVEQSHFTVEAPGIEPVTYRTGMLAGAGQRHEEVIPEMDSKRTAAKAD
jgi:uncharacterized NAD-dependent epimerase/dehydratase family protein